MNHSEDNVTTTTAAASSTTITTTSSSTSASEVIDNVKQLKSNGTFDQFRRECLADIDSKPAFQALKKKVEDFVKSYLAEIKWNSTLKKSDLRENLRKKIIESGIINTRLNRIVDQVVNPKIDTSFRQIVEKLVSEPETLVSTDYNQTVYNKPIAKTLQTPSTPPSLATPSTATLANLDLKLTEKQVIASNDFIATTSSASPLQDLNQSEIINTQNSIVKSEESNEAVVLKEELTTEKQQEHECDTALDIDNSLKKQSPIDDDVDTKPKLEETTTTTSINVNLKSNEEETKISVSETSQSISTATDDKKEKLVNKSISNIKTTQQKVDKNRVIKSNNLIDKKKQINSSTSSTIKTNKEGLVKQHNKQVTKKTVSVNSAQKVFILDTQTLKKDPKNEYNFDWKLDVYDESNNYLIDELSASSVHTSDLSDYDELLMDINEETNNHQAKNTTNNNRNKRENLKSTNGNGKLVNDRKSSSNDRSVNNIDSSSGGGGGRRRSRSATRRKRLLNPKYYSKEFTQHYNLSRSRSRSNSKNRSNSR